MEPWRERQNAICDRVRGSAAPALLFARKIAPVPCVRRAARIHTLAAAKRRAAGGVLDLPQSSALPPAALREVVRVQRARLCVRERSFHWACAVRRVGRSRRRGRAEPRCTTRRARRRTGAPYVPCGGTQLSARAQGEGSRSGAYLSFLRSAFCVSPRAESDSEFHSSSGPAVFFCVHLERAREDGRARRRRRMRRRHGGTRYRDGTLAAIRKSQRERGP